jgi:hypothetical protein
VELELPAGRVAPPPAAAWLPGTDGSEVVVVGGGCGCCADTAYCVRAAEAMTDGTSGRGERLDWAGLATASGDGGRNEWGRGGQAPCTRTKQRAVECAC